MNWDRPKKRQSKTKEKDVKHVSRSRYEKDAGLGARMFGTLFGLGLLYVILAGVLVAVGINAILVLVLSGGIPFWSVVVLGHFVHESDARG